MVDSRGRLFARIGRIYRYSIEPELVRQNYDLVVSQLQTVIEDLESLDGQGVNVENIWYLASRLKDEVVSGAYVNGSPIEIAFGNALDRTRVKRNSVSRLGKLVSNYSF